MIAVAISKDHKRIFLAGGQVIESATDPFDLDELNRMLQERGDRPLKEIEDRKGNLT